MNYGIDAGFGSVLIAGLVWLFRRVRNNGVRFEINQLRKKEAARVKNQNTWDQLNYRDVRKTEKRFADDSPSYFDAAATGVFRARSSNQNR